MDDETPAPPTPNGPSDDPSNDPSNDLSDDRLRDGVDPPEQTERDRSESGRSETDRDCDEERDTEPMEYRLERLRLLRTVVTLAVVIARLIRSF